MNETKMMIRLEEPVSSSDYLPPDDPLGELTSFELGIRRFCYSQNYAISIDIGGKSKEVFLFPDICLLIERLPQQITALSHGQPIDLEFPESWFSIELEPTNQSVICTVSEYGFAVTSKQFKLNFAAVLGTLSCFASQIVQLAVDGEYISQQEADQFLGKKRPEVKEVNGYQRLDSLTLSRLPSSWALPSPTPMAPNRAVATWSLGAAVLAVPWPCQD
jgi:hypothetical protein